MRLANHSEVEKLSQVNMQSKRFTNAGWLRQAGVWQLCWNGRLLPFSCTVPDTVRLALHLTILVLLFLLIGIVASA